MPKIDISVNLPNAKQYLQAIVKSILFLRIVDNIDHPTHNLFLNKIPYPVNEDLNNSNIDYLISNIIDDCDENMQFNTCILKLFIDNDNTQEFWYINIFLSNYNINQIELDFTKNLWYLVKFIDLNKFSNFTKSSLKILLNDSILDLNLNLNNSKNSESIEFINNLNNSDLTSSSSSNSKNSKKNSDNTEDRWKNGYNFIKKILE